MIISEKIGNLMIHDDVDYVMIVPVYQDGNIDELCIQLRYSKDTINRLKLCYDIRPPMVFSVVIYHARTVVRVNEYLLNCFYENDYYTVTFEWLCKLIHDEKTRFKNELNDDFLKVLDIAKKNTNSISIVKNYHRNRLEEMMDDIDFIL